MPAFGRLIRFVVLGIFSVGMLQRAAIGAGWSDDFNDGSVTDGTPVTWQQDLFGVFPGNYDASSGDYKLSAPGNGDNNQLVTWVDSVSLTDTYFRTQGLILPGTLPEETGGNLAILGRLDTNTVSAYVMYFDSGGTLGLQTSVGGTLTDIVPSVDLDFNATSEVILELNIVGNVLSGYAWQPGSPKPAEPQLVATDIDSLFASGPAGLAYDEDNDNTTAVYRYAMAQDTPFVDTPPGDFNNDGHVDAADYTTWRDGLGTTHTPEQYDIWKQNFEGAPGAAAASSSSVPEPTSMLFAAMAILCAIGLSRGQSRR